MGFGRISFCLNSFIGYFRGYLNSFHWGDFSWLGEIPPYRGKYQLPSKNGDFVKIQNSLHFWRWFWPFHHSFLPWLTCTQNFPGHKKFFLLACLPTPHLLYQRHNNELQNPPVMWNVKAAITCPVHTSRACPFASFPLYINREYTNINFAIAKHPLILKLLRTKCDSFVSVFRAICTTTAGCDPAPLHTQRGCCRVSFGKWRQSFC